MFGCRRRDPARTEARRNQILDAATQCFRQSGFRGASMTDISKAAGMSTGHIYHYFSSKESIIEAIVQRDRIHGLEIMEQLRNSLEIGTYMTDDGVDAMVDRPGKTSPALMMEIYAEAARNPIVADIVRNVCDDVRKTLLDVLETGQRQGSIERNLDAEDVWRILFFVYDGLTAHMAIYPDFDDVLVRKALRALFARLLLPSAH